MRDLNEKLSSCKNKISELENSNKRLKLISEQSQQNDSSSKKASDKNQVRASPRASQTSGSRSSSSRSSPKEENSSEQIRCKFDNTGKCFRGNECRDRHATKTCQLYSRLGFCNDETTCIFRHPKGSCYDWQNFGSCRNGDSCRYRHPIEWRPQQPEHFLEGNSPNHHRNQGQDSPVQHYKYHDLRGNRW